MVVTTIPFSYRISWLLQPVRLLAGAARPSAAGLSQNQSGEAGLLRPHRGAAALPVPLPANLPAGVQGPIPSIQHYTLFHNHPG